MAALPSKQTSPGARRSTRPLPDADPREAGLWWLWLVSDQAMIGAGRSAKPEPRPAAAAARSWAFADLALQSK